MANYQVTITMSADTVTKLFNGHYNLYGFKAIQSTQGGGLPLVWFGTDSFAQNIMISWQAQYQAYTSNSEIIPNGQVLVAFSADINLGQILNVAANGVGTVVGGGSATAISIKNTTATPFTCGISEFAGSANPICALPLYGNNMDDFTPLEKILLMFSTNLMNPGTAIEYIYDGNSLAAYSPGIFIDLTNDPQRTVSYDINEGWSWDGNAWAQQVPSDSNLVPFLIEDGDS